MNPGDEPERKTPFPGPNAQRRNQQVQLKYNHYVVIICAISVSIYPRRVACPKGVQQGKFLHQMPPSRDRIRWFSILCSAIRLVAPFHLKTIIILIIPVF